MIICAAGCVRTPGSAWPVRSLRPPIAAPRSSNRGSARRHSPGRTCWPGGRFSVKGYLDHHGTKLAGRFDALSYVRLTQAMATHDIERDREGLDAVLSRFGGELLMAAVESDRLFPVSASAAMVRAYGHGRLPMIHSPFGHDGCLIEAEQVASLVRELVQRPVGRRAHRVQPVA